MAGLPKPQTGPDAGAHNVIGNIFYGSKGYLAMSEYDSYKSWLGNEMEPGPADMALPITLPISLIACAAATKKTYARQSKKAIFPAH